MSIFIHHYPLKIVIHNIFFIHYRGHFIPFLIFCQPAENYVFWNKNAIIYIKYCLSFSIQLSSCEYWSIRCYIFIERKKDKVHSIYQHPRLLLINPWIVDFTAYDFWSKPLGLLYIASLLRQSGYQIDYIDCMDRYDSELLKTQNRTFPETDQDGMGPFYKVNIPKPKILRHIPRNFNCYGIPEEIFYKKIKRIRKPDAILVTSIMSYWYPGVFRVIELVKKYFPGCPVILGGIYATLCYQHAVDFSGAEYIINHFKISHLVDLLNNITGVQRKQILLNNDFQHLDCYPYPAWDLYPNLDYICLITGQGCPFRCSYCASYLLNPDLEFRNPHHIIEEIVHWKEEKGINHFIFYDDALLVDARQHFIPTMKELKKQNISINFYTPNALHAGLVTQLIAQLMIENGFKRIWLGFETADYELQKKTGAKIDNQTFKKAVDILFKAGFSNKQIRAYILIGLPGQSFKSVIDSINFVTGTGVKPYLAKFSPIPGTIIWNQAMKEYGWQKSVDPLWHNDALMPYHSSFINHQQYQQIKMMIQHLKL